jgi:ribonuclease VapC
MFVDASALVAIFAKEAERELFLAKIKQAAAPLYSPIVGYETVANLARISTIKPEKAAEILQKFAQECNFQMVQITAPIGAAAIGAFSRFGKGRHPAALNMGDCFSYACATAYRSPLLFKGNDFTQTDIQIA